MQARHTMMIFCQESNAAIQRRSCMDLTSSSTDRCRTCPMYSTLARLGMRWWAARASCATSTNDGTVLRRAVMVSVGRTFKKLAFLCNDDKICFKNSEKHT